MKRILFCSVIIFLSGCSSDFTPNGPYQQRLVVYAILDGNTSTQFIRVYGSYSPDDYDPSQPSPNTEVHNASVSVSDGQTTYLFHDTTIIASTGSAGSRSVHMYVNYAFHPEEKKQYALTVVANGFDTTKSVIKSISPGRISLTGSFVSILKPVGKKTIVLSILLGENVQAYLPRIFLEYDVDNDSVIRTREVPRQLSIKELTGEIVKIYPPIIIRSKSTGSIDAQEVVEFTSDAYISTIVDVKEEYPTSVVTFKRVVLSLVQFDNDLYTYYSIANNFGGSATLRLDEPDYTNIKNGFGIFGMYNSQEDSYVLPVGF